MSWRPCVLPFSAPFVGRGGGGRTPLTLDLRAIFLLAPSLSRAPDTGGGCGGASPPRNAITDRTAVRAPRGRPPIMSEAASPDATAVHSALLPSDRLGLPLTCKCSFSRCTRLRPVRGSAPPPAHSIAIARPADGLRLSVRAIDGGGFASRLSARLRLGSFSDARTNWDAIPERLPIIADERQRRQVAETHRRRYDRVGEVVDLQT